MANPFQGDDIDPFSAARDEEGNVDKKKAAPLVKAAVESVPKSKPKNRIVTKEELKKSGFTNLRDFLNAERGLKRRDGEKPEMKSDMAKRKPKFDNSKAAEVPKPSMDLTKKATEPAKRPMKISEIGQKKMSMEDKMKAVRGMAKGGMVKKKCDGIAKRGKTKGRMV